jgi:hypothetical protein
MKGAAACTDFGNGRVSARHFSLVRRRRSHPNMGTTRRPKAYAALGVHDECKYGKSIVSIQMPRRQNSAPNSKKGRSEVTERKIDVGVEVMKAEHTFLAHDTAFGKLPRAPTVATRHSPNNDVV